jgi:hypothetical protein
MADNQMVKIEFDFDLGNVPASAKKFAEYLKGIETTSKETQAQLKQLGNEIDKTADKIGKSGDSIKKTNQQWTNLALVLQDLPYGFRGIQNNLPALVGGIAGMTGVIYFAASAVIALVTAYDMGIFKSKAATEAAKARTEQLKKEKEATDSLYTSTANEAIKVNELIAVLENENETRDRKKRAIKELQSINPDIFKDLKLEGDTVNGINTYYNKYIENLKNVILLKQYEKDLEAIIKAELKSGAPLQIAKQKELKNSADLLNINNKAITDNITASKGLTLKDTKVINSINAYNIAQKQKIDLLEKIRNISPAVALSGGNDKKDKKVKEDPNYYTKIIEQEQKVFTDSLDNELKYADENNSKKLSILENYTNTLNHWHELGFIQESFYLNKSADLHKQIYDTKKSIAEQDSKDQKTINDRNLQNSLDALKIESDAQEKILNKKNKGDTAGRIKILEDYKNKLYELASVGGYTAEQFDKIDDALIRVDAAILGSKDQLKSFQISWTDTLNTINKSILDFVENSINFLAESLGKALAGQKIDVFQGLALILADSLMGLGKALIAYAVPVLLALTLLKKPSIPTAIAAIAAGVAAVAAGSFLKAKLTKGNDSGGGATAFANGGIISGPTMGLMGEYPGAKSNPEVVAPLDKLKGLIGGGTLTTKISGNDLYIIMNKASQNRNTIF